MFIRRTKTRSTVPGKEYYTHRLVRSERVGKKVQQRTLLNLGRHFDIDQKHWPDLCARIEQLLQPQATLPMLPLDDFLEKEAKQIVARLVIGEAPVAKQDDKVAALQTVDVDSLEMVEPRTVGTEALSLWALQQLQFSQMLDEAGFNQRQKAAAMALVIGRMVAPASELATHRWLQEQSALGELLDVDFTAMSHQQLYRSSDRLFRSRHRHAGKS